MADEAEDLPSVLVLVLLIRKKLSKGQQAIIAEDFCMDNNENILLIRKALLYYFEKRLRLDVAEALDNPQEAPVVIVNKRVFDEALAKAKA